MPTLAGIFSGVKTQEPRVRQIGTNTNVAGCGSLVIVNNEGVIIVDYSCPAGRQAESPHLGKHIDDFWQGCKCRN